MMKGYTDIIRRFSMNVNKKPMGGKKKEFPKIIGELFVEKQL
jgi:hypothetical protein